MAMDARIMVILPKGHYEKLIAACVLRGESLSGFGQRAVYAEMTRLGLLTPEGKDVLGVV